MDDLGSPGDWRLKGEGNANLVFAYAGSGPRLMGKVLRVRKPRAAPTPEQAALEEVVWAPVLGPLPAGFSSAAAASSSTPYAAQPAAESAAAAAAAAAVAAAAQREQRYVQRLLAPLLGEQYIPPQQAVHPSPAFLRPLLGSSGACGAGDAAAAAAGAAALMPDVTLLPHSMAGQQEQQQQAAAGAPDLQPPPPQAQQPCGQPVGPVLCVEIKPKCGFVASCGTVHPDNRDLKHSRSRYQLHQLLKLSQGKIGARSSYDPCDLFSGDPARLHRALAALLEQPQNNLLLFVDGRRQVLEGQQRHKGRRQGAAHPHAAAAPQQQQQQQRGQQQQEPAAQALPASLEQLLGGLLPLPQGQRRGALAELLAAVLEREGVLPRLLRAQQQCPCDIEGIYRLYCRLAGAQLHDDVPASSAPSSGSGSGSSGGSGGSDGSSSSGGGSSEAGDGSAAHAAAVARLLALPDAEAHAVLRSYVVAATAKDCALMVALQRLDGDGPLAGAAGGALEAASAAAAAAAGSAAGGAGAREARQPGEQQGWDAPPACIFCPSSGGSIGQGAGSGGSSGGGSGSGRSSGTWFRYRLAFVDLDQKPLAKIPAHAELDMRILAAARRHLESEDGGGSCGGAPAAAAGGGGQQPGREAGCCTEAVRAEG